MDANQKLAQMRQDFQKSSKGAAPPSKAATPPAKTNAQAHKPAPKIPPPAPKRQMLNQMSMDKQAAARTQASAAQKKAPSKSVAAKRDFARASARKATPSFNKSAVVTKSK